MPRYSPGDVVLVHYPWQNRDGSWDEKVRPAVVLDYDGDQERVVIQVTSKNRAKERVGIWVIAESKQGKQMGLLMDSFINVMEQRTVFLRDIVRQIGICPYMERIDELLDETGSE